MQQHALISSSKKSHTIFSPHFYLVLTLVAALSVAHAQSQRVHSRKNHRSILKQSATFSIHSLSALCAYCFLEDSLQRNASSTDPPLSLSLFFCSLSHNEQMRMKFISSCTHSSFLSEFTSDAMRLFFIRWRFFSRVWLIWFFDTSTPFASQLNETVVLLLKTRWFRFRNTMDILIHRAREKTDKWVATIYLLGAKEIRHNRNEQSKCVDVGSYVGIAVQWDVYTNLRKQIRMQTQPVGLYWNGNK